MAGRSKHDKVLNFAALLLVIAFTATDPARSTTIQDMGSMTVFHIPTEVQSVAKPQVKVNINSARSSASKSLSTKSATQTFATSAVQRMVPTGFLDVYHGVTPAFVNEIEIAMQKLPYNTVRALSQHGYHMSISRTVPDAVPAARNQQVRGYEPSATWNSVFGMFNRSTKRVVMAETAELPDGLGGSHLSRLNNRERRQGIVRHEFGHAVDQYLGNFSHTPQFKAAYDQGAAQISTAEREVLNYYLQPGDAGKEETFAELFAALDEDACDKNSDILLRNHFSQLAKLIRQKVANI